jgi:hypothetical protein
MPPRVAQTTRLIVDASTKDAVGYPPGFDLAEPTAATDLLSTPPRDNHPTEGNENSTARRLKSFTKQVLKKVNSTLIR